MKIITKQELITLVNGVSGATFISADIATSPQMRKTDNPYLGAVKIVTLSGAINFNYEDDVNRQLQREGKVPTFTAQKRAWGKYENNWVTHKGAYYLPIKVQSASDPVFKFNGQDLDKKELEPFLYESHKPHTQENVEKEIIIRDVKIDNIKVFRAFGEEFVIA